jgi:PAS domain S-box-containing protein
MEKELRILILEDVPSDAELEEHELRKAGLIFTSKIVDTSEDFLKSIEEFSPDLILSDYKLPSFDGLSGLKIAKENRPDVPFILVTGELGEEFAIETLKKGVTDYVLKSNLKRLVPSVKRALQEAEEITERKRLRRVLQESETLYRLLAENTNDMITRHLPDGTYLYVSPACRTLFGYEPGELIGTNAFAQMHPEDVKRVISITQESVRTGGSNVAQYRHRTKDGRYIWVETAGKVVKNELTGNIEDIICVVRDITDRKEAENEILRIKNEWENIFQAIGNPTIILDPDHNIISANRATITALGVNSANEIKGKKCYEFFHNASQPPEGCPLVKLRDSLQLTNVEIEVEALGGTYLVSCTPIFDEKGDLQKVIHIATDISERKQIEETLKKSEQQIYMLLDSTAEAIYGIDLEGNCTFLNKACHRILGYDDDRKILGENMHNLIHFKYPDGSEYPAAKCKIYQAFKRGERVNVDEEVFWKADGTSFPVEYWSYPIKEEGKAIGAVVSFIDITERKKAEEMDHIRTDQIILNKEALLELTRMQTPDIETFSKIITLMCSQVLGVERVSVWFYNNVSSEIICEALYILSKHSHEKGFRLRAKDYPKYFKALEEDPLLAADDAHTDPRTNEFTEQYLKPLGIFSMMDIPIRRHGKVIGVMCYESIESRQWTYEDQHFTVSVAHIVASALEDFKRKKAEESLKASEQELKKRVNDLEDFYKMAVGRELRMKELKEEIAELKQELGKYTRQ